MRPVHHQGSFAYPGSAGDCGDHRGCRLSRIALGEKGIEFGQLSIPTGEVGHSHRKLPRH
jgi:hypothetical protein